MNFAIISTVIVIIRSLIKLVGELLAVARQNRSLNNEEFDLLEKQIKALGSDATKPDHWKIEP
jgi:hypothetical protein